MKLLLLGGYGTFGARLAELIADLETVEILIAGRDLGRAEAFCRAFPGPAQARPVQLDRRDIADALAALAPSIVIDASGPFQAYGDDPYLVPRACIEAGVHYLDLADAADFVFGISQLDKAAKVAGDFVLSGVSSFPVLSAAVLREVAQEMQITSVTGGVAPTPRAAIGLNVVRAIATYAGGPVKLVRNGAQVEVPGLTETRRDTIAPPGYLPLRNTLFSLVDVPDLQVIPPEYPGLQSIWMGAGPRPEGLHRMLILLARLRSALRLPSFAPLSPLFYRALNLVKFGEHRGGMFVRAEGRTEAGERRTVSWHLIAEGDAGPYIPSMACEALLRKCLSGEFPAAGARPATTSLTLDDFKAPFAEWAIVTGFRRQIPDAPMYRTLLGHAFDALPPAVQTPHDQNGETVWSGRADVRRGRNPLARLTARAVRFPSAGKDLPVSVTLTPGPDGERWRRNFDGATFESFQSLGQGRNQYLLMERFGIITVALAVVVQDGRLFLIPRHWSCLGIPLPRFLLPTGDCFEEEIDGRFRFDVTIQAPLVGLVVAYWGWLEKVDP